MTVKGRYSISSLGIVVLALLVAGLLLLFLGSSHTVQGIGMALIVVALLPPAAVVVQSAWAGVSPASFLGRAGPDDRTTDDGSRAEYIAQASEAPASAWERERELYREKDQREQ